MKTLPVIKSLDTAKTLLPIMVNVNYKSDDNKNEIHWQIATSRNTHVHSKNTENNTVERKIKSSDIDFVLSNRFSPLHNDDQNVTTK